MLGMVRSRDAPVFGADVSLQKARTAALISSNTAASFLDGLPNANYLDGTSIPIADYVTAAQTFFDDPTALATGELPSPTRANGNLSRPFFPDGSRARQMVRSASRPGNGVRFPRASNSISSTTSILQHVVFILGGGT